MRTIAAAMLLAAGLASAAGASNPQKDLARAHKGEAKRHIWTSDIALEQARIGLQGLYALVDDTEAFDQTYASSIVRMVERDVDSAAAHLAKLTLVPAEKSDARTNLSKLQMDLAQVQAELKGLKRPVRADQPLEMKGFHG